jgi:hypothetical protein
VAVKQSFINACQIVGKDGFCVHYSPNSCGICNR